MSDMSVLSQEYQEMSSLAREVSRAVIDIKKNYFQLAGDDGISPGRDAEARQFLASIVEAIQWNLEPTTEALSTAPTVPRVPDALVLRLKSEHVGHRQYFRSDLDCVRDHLGRPQALVDGDIALLDQIAAATDAEASAIFRRMMRR